MSDVRAAPVRIDVVRGDGDVTSLRGQSGIAVCAPKLNDMILASDPATVSLRCDTAAELAWNLATLMASVRHVSPDAYYMAHDMVRYIDPSKPQLGRKLPPWNRGS